MHSQQPNGPRPTKTTGRLRHTLTNTASKQDVHQAQKPGRASYGRHTRPQRKTTQFQQGQRLQKLAQKTAPAQAPAPKVQTATPQQRSGLEPIVAFASLTSALQALQGQQNGGGGGGSAPGGDPQSNIQLAKSLAKEFGWTGEQWRALKQLGMRESGWRTDAANPTSTARGIPQAMMSVHFGDDWQTNPEAKKFLRNPEIQIRWMLDYITGRYGDPLSALRFHNKNNWY